MKKIIILMVLISIFMVFGASNVFAEQVTCSIVSPASSGVISASSIFNMTFLDAEFNETVTAYWNVTSSSTANSSSLTLILNATNQTGAAFMTNNSIGIQLPASVVLEDSNDYTVTGSISANQGATVRVNCGSTSTSVVIDRTAPSVATSDSSAGTTFDDVTTTDIAYSVTGTDTTSCRIAFLDSGKAPRFTGTNTFAMTHSGDKCTYTVTKASVPDGSYDVYVQASDGTNTSASSKIDFRIKTIEGNAVDPVGQVAVDVGAFVAEKNNALMAALIIIFVVLGWAALFRKP